MFRSRGYNTVIIIVIVIICVIRLVIDRGDGW
jgi:hypothetical protein